MGNKVFNLLPGSPSTAMIKDGGIVKPIPPVSIDDIMNNLEATTRNAGVITGDITVLTTSARTGKGAIGRIFMDSTFSQNLSQTMVNAKKATGGLNENMEAAKHNFLLKGYFKKKERKAAEKAKEAEKEKAKKQ